MSYDIVRSCSILKDGTVRISAACDNTRPLKFCSYSYHGTLAQFIESCVNGNFRLYNSVKPSIRDAVIEAERLTKYVERMGLTWEECFRYKLGNYNNILSFACREIYEPEIMGEYVNRNEKMSEINRMIKTGKKNIDDAKEKDTREGRLRIATAAYSIFDGFDLFWKYGSPEPFLAPEKDYTINGQIVPSVVISLGMDASDLYSFLSFSGVNLTRKECSNLYGEEKMNRVDEVVKRVLGKGLNLKENPYRDFKIA